LPGASAAAPGITIPRPKAPPARRVSGPARPKRSARTTAPIPVRVGRFVRALPDHPLLDRLVRGRWWIPVLAVMLSVIVAMQVSLLRLGASIGHSIERSTALQGQNELLRAKVATLADDQRIERIAAGMGMVMPAPTGVTFLSSGSSTTAQDAAQAIATPDPAGFSARLQASAASAAAAAGGAAPSKLNALGTPATVSAGQSTGSGSTSSGSTGG
jgi:hypothetical protein